jgi:hypothetical protein
MAGFRCIDSPRADLALSPLAYQDTPLPIGFDKTIS